MGKRNETYCDRCGRVRETDHMAGYWMSIVMGNPPFAPPKPGVQWDYCPACYDRLLKFHKGEAVKARKEDP